MRFRRVAALSAALVLIGATAASAAGPPYTVAVGGNSAAGTERITATSAGPVRLAARNNSGTLINYNCTSISLNGTITRGTSVNPIVAIDSTEWTGCRLPGGPMRVTQNGTWNILGTGSNATAALTDSIPGFVGNVNAGFASAVNPAICSFTVTGQMKATLDEATQQLRISETGSTGNLTLSQVGPCLGQVQNGNPFNIAATFNINSTNGAINLS